MTHEIPDHITNSAVEHCIAEYVRLERNRDMLRDHWFRGVSLMRLADKYGLSLTAVKRIIYGVGDKVLEHAEKIEHQKKHPA